MLSRSYIQVILPLRLAWEPWYSCEEEISAGDRVLVRNAGKEYVAVVSRVSDTPELDVRKIKPVERIEKDLEKILPSEIAFWRFISEYYLCSIGEVYRYAYPAGEIEAEGRKSRKKIEIRCCGTRQAALQLENTDKPLLIQGTNRDRYYEQYISRTLSNGRDVLILRPGKSRESFATRREYAKAVRSEEAVVIDGNKCNIFLPFTKLGLVIIDDEGNPSFKNNGSAPRFNGRDAAIMLAKIHNADVIIGSLTPSLETMLNVENGRYRIKEADRPELAEVEVIDTDAEFRKNGMVGDRSRKLIAAEEGISSAGGKYLEVNSWEISKAVNSRLGKYDLVAVLHAEMLSSKSDFRADEKYLRTLELLRSRCKGRLIVQTKSSDVCTKSVGALLQERKQFGFPPFTRLVEIRKRNLEEPIKRYFLRKDSQLAERKKEIAASCPRDCFIDVDPL